MIVRKSLVFAVFAMLTLFIVTGCGDSDENEDAQGGPTAAADGSQLDLITELYENAMLEGEVVILSSDDLYTRLAARGFNQRFPGIKVVTEAASPTERATRVIAMDQAGNVTVDLFFGSGRDAEPVFSRNLAVGPEDINWSDLGYPPELIAFDGQLALHTHFVYAHLYNTEFVTLEELPTTLEGFIDPKWRGKIVASPFLYPAGYAFVALAVGEEQAVKQAKELFDTANVNLSLAYLDLMQNGEFPVILFSSIGDALTLQSNGVPVEFFFTDDMGTAALGFVILKDAPNPNAARLFTYWLGTEEGREALFAEDTTGLAVGPFETPISKIITERNLTLILETESNWVERARLTGVIREAVIGQ